MIASDETNTSSVAVTVTVTDVTTEPGKVSGVTVSTYNHGLTTKDISWALPTGLGLSNYKVRWREAGTSTAWLTGDTGGATQGKNIGSLKADKKYEVQVRAVNADGEGAWSDLAYFVKESAAGSQTNKWPAIHTHTVVGLAIAENTTGNIGGPIEYTELNSGDTIAWSLGGSDASSFAISSGGQLSLASGVTFDYETQNAYSITVTVSDGTATDTENVTVMVSNVDELGTVTLSPAMLAVGTEITASLTDPDGSVSVTAWRWLSSSD